MQLLWPWFSFLLVLIPLLIEVERKGIIPRCRLFDIWIRLRDDRARLAGLKDGDRGRINRRRNGRVRRGNRRGIGSRRAGGAVAG